MNPQEKRIAERGPLAQWVRNTARFVDTRHELFERVPHSKNKDEEVMKYFAPGFGVGRMQSDEWLNATVLSHQERLDNWYQSK